MRRRSCPHETTRGPEQTRRTSACLLEGMAHGGWRHHPCSPPLPPPTPAQADQRAEANHCPERPLRSAPARVGCPLSPRAPHLALRHARTFDSTAPCLSWRGGFAHEQALAGLSPGREGGRGTGRIRQRPADAAARARKATRCNNHTFPAFSYFPTAFSPRLS